MRAYKFIIIGVIITVIAVGYVHQQVEIVKTGYRLQKNRRCLSYLIEQNSNLMYSLSKVESPRYLLDSLNNEDIRFADHRIRQVHSYRLVQTTPVDDPVSEGLMGKVLDLFTLNAEAKSRR